MAIGANWAEIWADIWGPVWSQTAPEPQPEPEVVAQTAAGKSRKRRRLFVEIDGQQFEVESAQHAQAILERAKALAVQAAEEAATEIAVKRKPTAKVAAVKIEAPKIKASPELKLNLAPIRNELAQVYDRVAMELELRLLLERQAAEDEEEAVFLLM